MNKRILLLFCSFVKKDGKDKTKTNKIFSERKIQQIGREKQYLTFSPVLIWQQSPFLLSPSP